MTPARRLGTSSSTLSTTCTGVRPSSCGRWTSPASRSSRGAAFRAGGERDGFRLTHYSVQGNHLHLIVEAADKKTLSRGMQGLAIRIARMVNRVAEREGRVFADHYFAHQLKTATEVRHAIRYVLQNRAIHAGVPDFLDRFSSAVEGAPVRPATFWLLTIGWRRARGAPRWDRRVPL